MNIKTFLFMSILSTLILDSCSSSKTIYVAAETTKCIGGGGPMECLLIKEHEADSWTINYRKIDGFKYELGYEYKLKVEEINIENAPADRPSIVWRLKDILSKRKVELNLTSKGSYKLQQKWELVSMTYNREEISLSPQFKTILQFEENNISGKCCNSYNGSYTLLNDTIMISPLASTRKMCIPEISSIENIYYKILQDKGKITFNDKGDLILIFSNGILHYKKI